MNSSDNAEGRLLAVHPVLMATNVERAITFYEGLGFTPVFIDNRDKPTYAGLRRDEVEIHIQWNELPDSTADHDRPVYRFLVQDVDSFYQELLARNSAELAKAGTTPWHKPGNTPWGTREFHVRDINGNGLQFYQSSSSRGAGDDQPIVQPLGDSR